MFHVLGYSVLLLLWVCCDAQNDDCGPPPRRNNEELANLSDKQTYSHGEVVLYNCRPGFIKLGRIRVRCNNGNWEKLPPSVECRKRPCGHPGDIEFGSFELVNGDEFVFGARVEYQCDPGYQMLSQTNYRVCRADGWSNDVPHCEVKKCFPVKPPENGRILMSGIHGLDQDYIFGQALRFECNPKFKMVGAKQIVCADEGQWNPDVPTCKEIICTSGNIANGYITSLKDVYKEGDQLQFDCHDGYKPVDRSVAVCSENGWNTRLECTEIVCSRPEVNNGRVNPHQQQYSSEETIQIECDPGYEPERREATSKCTKNGWLPQPKCLYYLYWQSDWHNRGAQTDQSGESEKIPTCKSDPPANGYFTVRKVRFALNEITRYRCHIGFTTREGHEEGESRCLREGWTPKPECVQTCQKPTDGNVIISITKQVFVLEENLPYKCADGYETITKALKDSSKCTVNGWSPKPQCLPIQCEVLDLDNGEVKPRKDQYLYSDIVQFSCRPGRIRVGPISAQCYHFGWSPPPPICKAAGKINSCQPPSNITDGIIITAVQEEYQHGQQVEYECNLKYAMTGSKKIECVDGQWTSLPSCTEERRTCGPPPRIDNGHALSRGRKNYFHGNTVRYECAEGFSVVGTNPGKCLHGHWDFPSCTELCSPPPQPPNATKIIEVRNFENGEKIRFACQENFLLEGPQEILCEDGRWGKPPRCIDASCGNPPTIANGASVNGTQGRFLRFAHNQQHFQFRALPFGLTSGPRVFTKVLVTLVAHLREKRIHLFPYLDDILILQKRDVRVIIPYPVRVSLKWWTLASNLSKGQTYLLTFTTQIFTDASLEGWGATFRHHMAQGHWNQAEKRMHINRLELRAIRKALLEFQPLIQNHHLLLRMDNISAKAHINKEGGSRSSSLHAEATAILSWAEKHLASLRVEHIKGEMNTQADWLSCQQVDEAEWALKREVFLQIVERFGLPLVDVFTSHKNHQTPSKGSKMSNAAISKCIRQCIQVCYQYSKVPVPLGITAHSVRNAACGEPPTITNADIISGRRAVYKPDHHVQYRCHAGFEMSGSDNVTCGIKVWSKPPTCEDVTCPPPTEIAHGEIVGQPKERYMPSERVRYQCDPGWNPSGPMVVTCFNKQWTKLPRCIDPKANCGPPPGIQNGDFLNPAQASYPPGTTLRYQCQNLYVMNGSSEVRCENGHWTETPTCIEACTVSEEDMARNNIWLKWRSDPKLYSQSGDTMEFRCIWNHREAPLSPPFRTQCIQGNVEYPRCIPGY
uniref:complement factor H-like n=1 Tax=Euleptes europaea TaxID=460621 RepID=UPI002540D869|nr:complement factor H-like [Euleptes europaea]